MKATTALLLTFLPSALLTSALEIIEPHAPETTPGPLLSGRALEDRSGHLTIAVTNKFGSPISLAFDHNQGGPAPINAPLTEQKLGATSTQFTFPTGWAGRIYVGKTIHKDNSKIEASFTNQPFIDVSYVDGFSLPITCAVGGKTVTGCNIPLLSNGKTCPNLDNNGPVCINPQAAHEDGPATPFFADCQGAAYTYPTDDLANIGSRDIRRIDCCVGASCPAPPQQKVKNKRAEAPRRRHVRNHVQGRANWS